MDVSIIIVNYNTSKLINNCIKSIFRHVRDLKYEIIVVDNNTENLYEKIIEAENPLVHLLHLSDNKGFGCANNEGFKIAKGRNILCLNPDTILLNNAVKILSDYLDSNEAVGACGGNLYDENMKPTLSFRRILPGIKWEINELLNLIPEKILFGKNQRFNYSSHPIIVSYISGADLMIPRKIFKDTKGFSPDFFMYYEETDLCSRIHRLGKKIICVPQAKIQHLEGSSFDNSSVNYRRLQLAEKGRITYLIRNHSHLYIKISNYIYRCFLYSRALLKKSESYSYRLSIQKKFYNQK